MDLERLFERFFPADALASGLSAAVEKAAAPLFSVVRAELLKRVCGDPPAGFGKRLEAQGWPPMDDAKVRAVWETLIASIAESPGDEYLRAVS